MGSSVLDARFPVTQEFVAAMRALMHGTTQRCRVGFASRCCFRKIAGGWAAEPGCSPEVSRRGDLGSFDPEPEIVVAVDRMVAVELVVDVLLAVFVSIVAGRVSVGGVARRGVMVR